MATVTDYTSVGPIGNSGSSTVAYMAEADKLDTVEMTGLRLGHPHVFIGVRLYNSVGVQIDTTTSGEFTVSVKTWNTGRWESLTTTTIDATAAETVDVQGTIVAVKVEPTTAITGDAASYEVRVSAHQA